MVVLQIEHKVPNYDGWKKAFESDPIGRQRSGVKRYRVYRQSDDLNNVIIDLEFEDPAKAEAMLSALKALWGKVEGSVMMSPQARILNMTDSLEY